MSVVERILITGAGGQIGNKLIPALLSIPGKQIWATDLKKLDLPSEVHTELLDISVLST
jgi:dTDP-4-dehydrorhamnose reductase